MDDGIRLSVLGHIRCAATAVADVPSQGLPSRIELRDRYRPALLGLEPGDHVYVLVVFDRAEGELLRGSPGTAVEQGAFSIRSSQRPNRLGMTLAMITAIDGATVHLDWADFADGTPVVDIKRYNWRWECVLAARRLDRRAIERQIDRVDLVAVLRRPAVNLHGERCQWVDAAAELGAALVHDHDVWLGSPDLALAVSGSGHLVDALQGITGATLGNGRLRVERGDDPGSGATALVRLRGDVELDVRWDGAVWTQA